VNFRRCSGGTAQRQTSTAKASKIRSNRFAGNDAEHLGHADAAKAVIDAIETVLVEGPRPDAGGTANPMLAKQAEVI
jgi:hypothetical protein